MRKCLLIATSVIGLLAPTLSNGDASIASEPTDFRLFSGPVDRLDAANGAVLAGQTISANLTGLYVVSVTDANGCTGASAPVSVQVIPSPVPTITALGPTTFCVGGSVTLVSSTASSYLWNTGETTQEITVSTSGNYVVTVTDEFGCVGSSSSTNVFTNDNPIVTVSASGPTEFCIGGTVTLTATGGIDYQWSTGDITDQITVASTGTFTVTVTNVNNCSTVSDPVDVVVNPLPTPSITADGPTTFCDGGSVTLTASAGASYLWSTGETTQSIVVTTTGSYNVTVTDANGCSNITSNEAVFVLTNPTATVTASGPTSFCQGGQVELTCSPNAFYLWNTGETLQTITVDSTGSYTVTVTDMFGCIGTGTVAVEEFADPFVIITPDGPTTFCVGGEVTLTASGGVDYLWNTGANVSEITIVQSGNYVVNVTDANGCPGMAVVTVIVNDNPTTPPTISADGPTTFCSGGSVTLTADSWASYAWNTGETPQSIVVTQTGFYSLEVADINGCSPAGAGVMVFVNPSPTPLIQASGDLDICTYETLLLTTGVFNSFLWSTGETTQMIEVDTTGSYSVTVTNSFGCTGTSATQDVVTHVAPVPAISLAPADTVCPGTLVTLSVNATDGILWSNGATTTDINTLSAGMFWVRLTDPFGCMAESDTVSVSYFTQTLAGISVSGNTAFCSGNSVDLTATEGQSYLWGNGATTQTITVTQSGIYSVSILDTNGCAAAAAQTITVLPSPEVFIAPEQGPPFCLGDTVTLGASFVLNCTYLWSTGSTETIIDVWETGVYAVTVANTYGCSDQASIPVIFNAPPDVNISVVGPDTICVGEVATIEANLIVGGTYLWNTQAVGQSIDVTEAGLYSVMVTNAPGCTDSSNVVAIATIPGPVAVAGPDVTICPGDTAQLFGSGNAVLNWDNGVVGQENIVSPSATTTYTLTASVPGCTITATDEVTVNIAVLPVPDFEQVGNDIGSVALFNDISVPNDVITGWAWTFSDGATSTQQNPTHIFATHGQYEVQMVITSIDGCMDSILKVITLDTLFTITNTLTPDNDGVNDYVWFTNTFANHMLAEVYNRWGAKVWEGMGFNDLRFYGRTNSGKELEAGTYYYILYMDLIDNRGKEVRTGFISLIK